MSWSIYKCITKNLLNSFKIGKLFFHNVEGIKYLKQLSYRNFGSDKQSDYFKSNSDEVISQFIQKDLYPFTKDRTLISMKSLVNINEILQHYEDFGDQYNSQTFTQALQKIYIFQKLFPTQTDETTYNKLGVLLDNMNKSIPDMGINETIYCLLYLVNFRKGSNNYTMQSLCLRASNFLNDENLIPLITLSRFSYIINQRKEFCNTNICSKILTWIDKHLEHVEDSESLYLIATCFQNIMPFLKSEIIEKYKSKVEENIIGKHSDDIPTKYLLKISTFFSYPKWSNICHNLNRQLLIILSNKIGTMDSREVEMTCKLFESALEPAYVLPNLLNAAKKFNENNANIELIAFMANFNKNDRKSLNENAQKIINEMISSQSILKSSSFYRLLRNLKISDLNLCTLYWSKLLSEIKLNAEECNEFNLAKHCFRYMFFNNNVGGTFRHLEFEKFLSQLALKIINENQYKINNEIYTKLASFIIAYGIENNMINELPENLIENIEDKVNTFDHHNCLQLSKGVQIALELRFKHQIPQNIISKMNRIKTIIQNCVQSLLDNKEIDFLKLNLVIRTLNNIKVKPTSEPYVTAMEFYKIVPTTNINSRLIREMAFNLLSSNYLVSNIVNDSFKYIHDNKDYVLGDTVEKLLNAAYVLAYVPENEEALYWAAEIIKRDFEYMTSITIVQSCLALCYFRMLPLDLVQKIFTPEFIKKIEDEVELCYSKQTYPNRVFNQVMQLNRAICLDFPEMQLPWFQQNYIEAQMNKNPKMQSKLLREIENVLLSVVKNKEQILSNQSTPYGYTIDFVVHLAYSNKHLSSENFNTNILPRFAILLLRKNALCKNDNENIRGFEHMRVRHLEMLGFNVIHINIDDWCALHMNIPGAKTTFLKNLLKLA